jgi:YhcH/YjgK/YiaL family protein
VIFDHISNLSQYGSVSSGFDLITPVLKEPGSIEYNKWIFINENFKMIRLDRFSAEENFEFHRKFIDVHITVNGIDEILLGDETETTLIGEFNNELDYQLGISKSVVSVKNVPGFFSAFMPGELHRNRFLQEGTNKLVFKIVRNDQP